MKPVVFRDEELRRRMFEVGERIERNAADVIKLHEQIAQDMEMLAALKLVEKYPQQETFSKVGI